MASHNDIGQWGERKAAEYMRSLGFYIRHTDWQWQHKDLDLVCIDEEMTMLIIVEVKTRSTEEYGLPDEAVNLEKKNNLILAAQTYRNLYHLNHLALRYDTISIVGTSDDDMQLTHKENAFDNLDAFLYHENRRKHIIPYKPY